MPVGDIAVMRIVGRFQDQNIVNTQHWRVTTQGSGDEELWDQLCVEWTVTNGPLWLARMSDQYQLQGTKAFTVKGGSVPPGTSISAVSGDVAGDPQEAFVCRTITFYTDNANPRRRGRLMLSGGAENMFDDTDGSVASLEVGLLSILGANLMEDMISTDNTYELVFFQKSPEVIALPIKARGRLTPSILRSRRVKQFIIG